MCKCGTAGNRRYNDYKIYNDDERYADCRVSDRGWARVPDRARTVPVMRVVRPVGGGWRQHHRSDGTPKLVYPSLAAAQRARVDGADAYLCSVCRHWHLGRPPRKSGGLPRDYDAAIAGDESARIPWPLDAVVEAVPA